MAASDGAAPAAVLHADTGQSLSLPSSSFVVDGQFVRVGGDLKIMDGAGSMVVVEGYFAGATPPDLMSPDGTQILTPALVDSFLMPMAPGQYAQAAPVATAAPVGQVLDLNGDAFALRADGTRVQLMKGDAVYEGDVVETGGAGSAVRMVFTDKTEFSLGADARLALDQLVFNPDTQSGSAQFSVLKGVFIFASGQIAKTDNTDMTVTTPVATIGIRGTEVAGRVAEGDSQFTIIDGAIEVTTRAGSVTLDDRGETTQVAGNDSPPGDPFVLTPAQFGQAYGAVAGVVSGYFDPLMPGPAPGDGGGPSQPGDGSPDVTPPGGDDRTDAGTAPGGIMLATSLPAESSSIAGFSDTQTFAGAFASDPVSDYGITAVSTLSLSTGGSDPAESAIASGTTSYGAQGPAGVAGDGFEDSTWAGSITAGTTTAVTPKTADETVIAVVPGLDLAENITFDGSGGYGTSGGAGGFSLIPGGETGGAADSGAIDGLVQVALSSLSGTAGTDTAGVSDAADANDIPSGSPPLYMPSSGSSGSPFRSESGPSGPFAGSPHDTSPFGYDGPRLGDPIFALVAGNPADTEAPAQSAGADTYVWEPTPTPVPAAIVETVKEAEPVSSDAADITLTVSNATRNQLYQDLTNAYELPDEGPDSFVLIGGAEMGLSGVDGSARIALERDDDGNVEVALTSAQGSVKNIRAVSDTAADIRIDNFVHTDVHFGDGDDSRITIVGAKRGFVTSGDGNDTIAVEAVSRGVGSLHRFDLRTGAGDDLVVFDGASDGLSELYIDGGAGVDTLRLTGPGQTFDFSTGQVQIANVERIDISGAGDATLLLPPTLFDGLTGPAPTLVVGGDDGDTLDLQGDGWAAVDSVEIDGQGYTVYQNEATDMRIAADRDLAVV